MAERDGAKLARKIIAQEEPDVLQQAEELVSQALVTPQAQRHENGAAPPAQDEQEQPSYWSTQLFTVAQFLERPPKQWLVQDVLGVQDMALLYGEPGSGKTFVALDLAFSLATGRQFADAFSVTRPLTVAYATSEGVGGLPDRLRAVSTFYGTQDVPLFLFADAPQLFDPGNTNGAYSFVHDWQDMARAGRVPATLDVLMVDTLHGASAGSDENSARDAGKVLDSLRCARKELGCATVLVHHANKAGTSERGSTALRGAMDCVLRAEKAGKAFTLRVEKLKDGALWIPKSFDLVSTQEGESVRVFWQGDAKSQSKTTREQQITTYLDEHAGVRYTASEIAEALGVSTESTTVLNVLTKMRTSGKVWSDKETRKAGVVDKDVNVYWRE